MGSSWTRARTRSPVGLGSTTNLAAACLVEGPVRKIEPIEIEGEQQVDVGIGEDLAPVRR